MAGRRVRAAVSAAVPLLLVLGAVAATGFVELSLASMIDRSEIALYGEVVSVDEELVDGVPWTRVAFAVDIDLLEPPTDDAEVEAEVDPEIVTLRLLGGALPDGGSLAVEGMPVFVPGERAVVLAYRARYASPIVGFSQGVWWEDALGFRDTSGRRLTLDDEGGLLLDGDGGDVATLLEALALRFEERP